MFHASGVILSNFIKFFAFTFCYCFVIYPIDKVGKICYNLITMLITILTMLLNTILTATSTAYQLNILQTFRLLQTFRHSDSHYKKIKNIKSQKQQKETIKDERSSTAIRL